MKFRQKKSLPKLPSSTTILNHPLIARTEFIFHDDSKLYYVTKYAPGVPFLKYLDYRSVRFGRGGRINEEQLKFYVCQFVSVLSYLHSKGVVYEYGS